jgi:hypothetical protein
MDNNALADRTALDRLLMVQPLWCSVATAASAVALEPLTLLHAGPPFSSSDAISQPIFNSAVVAILYEGWANTIEQAADLIQTGQVQLQPAQDRQVVTPLAAVVSPSMMMQVVCDRHDPNQIAYSPLHAGPPPAPRFGTLDWAVVDQLRWLNQTLAEALTAVLSTPIPLIPLAEQSLQAGEECHSLTRTATDALIRTLQPLLLSLPTGDAVLTFLHRSPSFFLNLWMAACKCILNAATGVPNSQIVTAMAGNGNEFGVQISNQPGDWITVSATPPRRSRLDDDSMHTHCGAIGDSAVIDALGFGGMALPYAPDLTQELQPALPIDALQLPSRLLLAEHPGFQTLRPAVGLSLRRILSAGAPPLINLAILGRDGSGMIGRGVYRPPLELFEQAAGNKKIEDVQQQ